jgi:hypothetical protein
MNELLSGEILIFESIFYLELVFKKCIHSSISDVKHNYFYGSAFIIWRFTEFALDNTDPLYKVLSFIRHGLLIFNVVLKFRLNRYFLL